MSTYPDRFNQIFAYIISQMINLTIYKRLMDNKDNNKLINMRKSILDVLSSYSPEGTIKLCTKMLNDSYNKRRY